MKFSWEYFLKTFPLIAEKLPGTLSLTLISAGFSLALGTVMALVNYYRVPVLTQFLKAWSSFIRGTPAVTQMFFFYYGLATVSVLVLNMSSLAFLVGIRDVMGASKIESAGSFRFFECYAIVMLVYWACTIVLTFLQRRLEKRCNAIYE